MSAALQDLLSGATLSAANTHFSDWQLLSLDATALPLPDVSLITVNPLAGDPMNPGLQFVANGQLSTTGINAIDLTLRFRVDAAVGSNSFLGHSLQMSGATFGGNAGLAYISAEPVDGAGADLGPTLVMADNEIDFLQLTDSSTLTPHTQFFVTLNVYLTGITGSDTVSLSSFTHSFSQTGPLGLIGDFNQDGQVDTADYIVWRDNFGSLTPLPNDATAGVGVDDYTRWRDHLGNSIPASAASATKATGAASGAVPEPTTIAICLGAIGTFTLTAARVRLPSQ